MQWPDSMNSNRVYLASNFSSVRTVFLTVQNATGIKKGPFIKFARQNFAFLDPPLRHAATHFLEPPNKYNATKKARPLYIKI